MLGALCEAGGFPRDWGSGKATTTQGAGPHPPGHPWDSPPGPWASSHEGSRGLHAVRVKPCRAAPPTVPGAPSIKLNESFPWFGGSQKSGFLCKLTEVPGGSAGKESACNAGDPSSIPESGRSAGEGTGYPLQDSWASLVAQLVKNPPAMWETWVQSLGWEDSLEKGGVPTPVFWPGEFRGLSVGLQRVGHD